jgi:hypothetical protein
VVRTELEPLKAAAGAEAGHPPGAALRGRLGGRRGQDVEQLGAALGRRPGTGAGRLRRRAQRPRARERSRLLPYRLYSPGASFDGHALKAITRRLDAPDAAGASGQADFVNFIYGDCYAEDGAGCAPPLEVQVWPSCRRSRATYRLTPDGRPLPRRDASVRGVPAAWFEDGRRLELYTGKETIVLFGESRAQLARAAAALRGVNNAQRADARLPPPAAGALDGEVAC